MENKNWEVQINNIDFKLQGQVFIYRFIGSSEIEYLEIKSPEVIVHRIKNDGGIIPPTFVAPVNEAMAIAKAFVDYANSQGFKNGTETFAKGKLEAMESHLQDMRTLVFKDK